MKIVTSATVFNDAIGVRPFLREEARRDEFERIIVVHSALGDDRTITR